MSLLKSMAFVTGASSGIGKSIAERLLEEQFQVIGTRNHSPFSKKLFSNENFEPLTANLANQNDLISSLKPIFERPQAPDVLINNAGIFIEADMEQDDDDWLVTWDKTLQVNLKAAALLSKWAINSWIKNGEPGIIINIASRAAYRGDTQEYAAYAASKAGMVAFTKSLARNFGKNDIVAYSIAPGFTKTEMAMESIKTYGEEYLTQGMAFDEMTSPEEVAGLVAFLSSGKVKHMTGQTFHINGGSYLV